MATSPPGLEGRPRERTAWRPAAPDERADRPRLGWGRAFLLLFLAVLISVPIAVQLVENAVLSEPQSTAGDGDRGSTTAAAQPVTAPRIARDPADVGTPVGGRAPEQVTLELTSREVPGQLADGTAYTYWTFGETVPGPFLRVRVGDTVTLRLSNSADSTQPHSIDLHAVNGPGGGAAAMQVAPGETREFTFKALNPGLYTYHCATPHIPTHIANGIRTHPGRTGRWCGPSRPRVHGGPRRDVHRRPA